MTELLDMGAIIEKLHLDSEQRQTFLRLVGTQTILVGKVYAEQLAARNKTDDGRAEQPPITLTDVEKLVNDTLILFENNTENAIATAKVDLDAIFQRANASGLNEGVVTAIVSSVSASRIGDKIARNLEEADTKTRRVRDIPVKFMHIKRPDGSDVNLEEFFAGLTASQDRSARS